MHLKIFFLFLFLVSFVALYLAGNISPGISTYDQQTISRLAVLIPIILFIILVTSVIGFSLAMLSNEAGKAGDTQLTKKIDRTSLPKPEIEISNDMLAFLRLLQEEGRLIDYLDEDITTYDDTQVASASRVVHRGCSTILKKYLSIAPVLDSQENSIIEFPLDIGEDSLKLHGKKSEKLKVVHKGWRLISANLPKIILDESSKELLIVPAEGESV